MNKQRSPRSIISAGHVKEHLAGMAERRTIGSARDITNLHRKVADRKETQSVIAVVIR